MDHRQADSFHIPRWEELPAVDLYMEQVIDYLKQFGKILKDAANDNGKK